nr:hypothetical protein [Actinoplanes rishiriensis]
MAAIRRPRSPATDLTAEPLGTTTAAHSGWLNTPIVLIGEPLARATSAAAPAVEPTSMASPRSASLALLLPAESCQVTVTPLAARSVSSHFCSCSTRLAGL